MADATADGGNKAPEMSFAQSATEPTLGNIDPKDNPPVPEHERPQALARAICPELASEPEPAATTDVGTAPQRDVRLNAENTMRPSPVNPASSLTTGADGSSTESEPVVNNTSGALKRTATQALEEPDTDTDVDTQYGLVGDSDVLCEQCLEEVSSGAGAQFVLENTKHDTALDVGSLVHFFENNDDSMPRLGRILQRQILYNVRVGEDTYYTVSPEGFRMTAVPGDHTAEEATLAALHHPEAHCAKKLSCRKSKQAHPDVIVVPAAAPTAVQPSTKKPRVKAPKEKYNKNTPSIYIGRLVSVLFSGDALPYVGEITRYTAANNRFWATFTDRAGKNPDSFSMSPLYMINNLMAPSSAR